MALANRALLCYSGLDTNAKNVPIYYFLYIPLEIRLVFDISSMSAMLSLCISSSTDSLHLVASNIKGAVDQLALAQKYQWKVTSYCLIIMLISILCVILIVVGYIVYLCHILFGSGDLFEGSLLNWLDTALSELIILSLDLPIHIRGFSRWVQLSTSAACDLRFVT